LFAVIYDYLHSLAITEATHVVLETEILIQVFILLQRTASTVGHSILMAQDPDALLS
jgi:hypothetical protein